MKKIIFTLSMIALCLTLSAQKGEPSMRCQEGFERYRSGQTEEAIQCFDQDIKSNPKAGYSYWGKGLCLIYLERYDEAAAAFQQAEKTLPKKERYMAYLSEATVWAQKNEYERALELQNTAIKSNPQEGACYQQRGNLYSLMEYYSLAIPDYRKAIELNPQDLDSYYALCNILANANLGEAMSVNEQALTIERRNVYLLTQHAQLKCMAGKYEDALDDIISAMNLGWIDDMQTVAYEIADTIPDTFFERIDAQQNKQYSEPSWSFMATNVCFHLERPKSAQKYYTAAYEISGPDAELLGALYYYDFAANDYDASLRHLQELKTDWPEYDTTYDYNWALLSTLENAGRYNEAIRIADSLHQATTYDTTFWYAMVEYRLANGQTDEALQIFNTMIDTCQMQDKPYNGRAYLYLFYKKDTAAAIEDFRKALEIDSNRVMAWYMLGNKEKSIENIKKNHDFNSTNPNELFDIAECYSLINEPALAMKFLRKSFEQGFYWGRRSYIDHVADLNPIRDLPEFKALLDEYEAKSQR